VGVTVPDGEVSRGLFKGALREWLKCFGGSGGYGYARRWRA
jgi:hypothetical protein